MEPKWLQDYTKLKMELKTLKSVNERLWGARDAYIDEIKGGENFDDTVSQLNLACFAINEEINKRKEHLRTIEADHFGGEQ